MLKMNSRRVLLLLLIALTLHSKSGLCNYLDVGSNNGLVFDSLLKVKGAYYLQASEGDDLELIGAGLGFEIKSLRVVSVISGGDETAIDLHAMYYDYGMPVFISFGQNDRNEIRYKIGAGYPFNAKINLIAHYSDRGWFVGVRRWL